MIYIANLRMSPAGRDEETKQPVACHERRGRSVSKGILDEGK